MALLARTLRRSLIETHSASTLPPTFLLPFRAQISTVSHTLETGNVPDPLIQSGHRVSKELKNKINTTNAAQNTPPPAVTTAGAIPNSREDVATAEITPSIRTLLPLLHSQPAHYLTIHIHGRPYLITAGDTIRLPFLMPSAKPGDVLRLNRATHIGSRDYTLKAAEPTKGTRDAPKKVHYLDERLFTVRATVVGIESEPMRIIEKTKRRQRHIRHVKSQHRYTVIRIGEVEIRGLEEYERLVREGRTE